MSRIRCFMWAAALVGLTASPAWAQTLSRGQGDYRRAVHTSQQTNAQQSPLGKYYSTGHCNTCDSSCACESSCSDDSSCSNGCSSCSNSSCCCCCDPCDHGDPWTLFPDMDCYSVGGWIQSGGSTNNYGNPNQGPLGFNNKDGFELHQAWLYAERQANTECCGFDWGFRTDYVFGVDGPDTQAFGDEGWDFGWNSSSQYGSAIPQAYLEFAYNDLSVKVGHFYTIIGYQVVPAPDNFFYTAPYSMFYGEPFTHTGALATWTPHDDWTFYFGYTDGWDSGWENSFEAATFLGGVSYDVNDQTTVTWAVNAGKFGNGAVRPSGNGNFSNGDIYMNSFVLTHQATDKLLYVLQHDLGYNNMVNGAQDAEWYSIVQWLQYEINGCYTVGMRYEWFRDDDGARVASELFNGGAGHYHELSLGVNYRPHANVVVRPEARWDWYDGAADNNGNLPWDGGRRSSQFLGACDVIFTF